MAEFNPDVPDQGTPNYASVRSEGGQVDKSKGILFSGIGDLISGAAKTGDQFVQNSVKDSVNTSVDKVNQEFGFTSDTYGPGSSGQPGTGSKVPDELLQSTQGLSRLAQAQAQGKVTPEYYYQRLAQTMRGLRARYPGYEEFVDQAIQKTTGMNPANTFRDALLANINSANQATADQATQSSKFIQENIDKLTVQQQQQYFQGALSPNQAYVIIAAQKSKDYSRESSLKSLDYNQKMAEPTLSGVWQGYTNDTIAKVGEHLGGTGARITDLLSGGKTLTPDQIGLVVGDLSKAKETLQAQMSQDSAKYGTSLGAEKTQAMQAAAMKPIDDLIQMVQNKNFDEAARLTANITMQNSQTLTKLYADPKLGNFLKTTQALAGSNPTVTAGLINQWMQTPGGVAGMSYLQKTLAGNIATTAVNGDASLSDAAAAIINNDGDTADEKSKLVQGVIDGYTRFAGQADRTPDQIGKFVNTNYTVGTGNDKMWSGLPDDQKPILFAKMFDPAITAKIKASGNQDAWNKYESAAVDYFKSTPSLITAMGQLNQDVPFSNLVKIQYSPSTHQLIPTYSKDVGGIFSSGTAGVQMRGIKDTISALNTGLQTLGPIMDASGQKPSESMQVLLGQLNGGLGQDKQNTFMGYISKAINAAGDAATGGLGSGKKGQEGEVPSDVQDTVAPQKFDSEKISDAMPEINVDMKPEVTADAQTKLNALLAAGPDAITKNPKISVDQPTLNQIVQGTTNMAKELGVDPKDVLTAMSYETGGTMNPWQKGPTTKWGQHRGLIQMGATQRNQYGYDQNNSIEQNMGAIKKYLIAAGVKPGMGLMDIYSAINAGHVGLYNRSDAAAGGAPGTVADKVRGMGGHAAAAARMLQGVPSDSPAHTPAITPPTEHLTLQTPKDGWTPESVISSLGDGWNKSTPVPVKDLTPQVAHDLADQGYNVSVTSLARPAKRGAAANIADLPVGSDPGDVTTAPIANDDPHTQAMISKLRATANYEDRRAGNIPQEDVPKAFDEVSNEVVTGKAQIMPQTNPGKNKGTVVLTDGYAFLAPTQLTSKDDLKNVDSVDNWKILGTKEQYINDLKKTHDQTEKNAGDAAAPADNPLAASVEKYIRDNVRTAVPPEIEAALVELRKQKHEPPKGRFPKKGESPF